MSALRYRRILLKLGGEALAGEGGFGIDPHQANIVAGKIRRLRDMGAEVAVVIGAGNLWRGKDGQAHGMEHVTADHMGMLATVMNALTLADALRRLGIEPRVMTAIEMQSVAEPYIRGRAIRHLEKGYVILLAAGTGNPYFTTDTAAALRAMEIHAEVVIKATKVDGVYDKDPKRNPDARRFDRLTYIQALNMRVGVMDSTALTMCMDNDLPIIVLDLWQSNAVEQAVLGEPVGTLVSA
ncbi:MAG: Uridylate kinase [Chloroflexi bacterium ADurb.Bin325]|nr:MAG: Uridylate kinase [Chloroflexi bacterium ADurb.Bin325]